MGMGGSFLSLPKSVKRFSDKRRGENKGLEQERDSEIAHSALAPILGTIHRAEDANFTICGGNSNVHKQNPPARAT